MIRPILSLLLLAPLIAEVLPGFTRVSALFVLPPEIMTWGCGALLIREWVQRRGGDWRATLLLGLALATAEEWVIQQTSIAPLAGLARAEYGRALGVNWVYFLWAAGYEAVWVVLIPVQLTELLYPEQRNKPWLKKRGMAIATAVFLAGALIAWYAWTQQARVQVFHMAPYSPPVSYIVGALGGIGLLIAASVRLRRRRETTARPGPPPWLAGAAAFALGAPWSAFVLAGYGVVRGIPFGWTLAAGCAWAWAAWALARRWTESAEWGDAHRYAMVCGGIAGSMAGGFAVFASSGALRLDWMGKAVLNAAAAAWLIAAGRRYRARGAGAEPARGALRPAG